MNIKNMSLEELTVLAQDIRNNIISSCSVNGGHLASSLGVVELTVALHYVFDLPNDKVIFDIGHQCYAHKILSDRSLENLRKVDGVSGFQNREESPYDPYEAGHSSTSISAAMGFALTRDLDKAHYEVIAVIGDSALANGLSLEALNNLGKFNHKVIIVINDNECSIGPSVGYIQDLLSSYRYDKSSVTNAPYQIEQNTIFSKSNITYLGHINGHDISALKEAFEYAKKCENSVIVHVTTIKGKGFAQTEKDLIGEWHDSEPFDIKTGESLSFKENDLPSWSDVYASLLDKEMENNPKAVLINPATTVGSKMSALLEKYPERSFDVGISEEHAAIFASGIAANGYHPYLSIYSTFLQRAYDEVSHDIARMDLPVTLLIDRVGLPGEDGETHEGIFDVAYLSSMPNISIAMAKNLEEAKQLFEVAKNHHHPLAIRYPRGLANAKYKETLPLRFGEWKIENKGTRLAIISYGPVVGKLINDYPQYDVINAIFQKPLDINALKTVLNKENVVIYDVYGTKEGFANSVIAELSKLRYQGRVTVLAVPNAFIKHDTIEGQVSSLHLSLTDLERIIKGLD